jgi:hypothetical protein
VQHAALNQDFRHKADGQVDCNHDSALALVENDKARQPQGFERDQPHEAEQAESNDGVVTHAVLCADDKEFSEDLQRYSQEGEDRQQDGQLIGGHVVEVAWDDVGESDAQCAKGKPAKANTPNPGHPNTAKYEVRRAGAEWCGERAEFTQLPVDGKTDGTCKEKHRRLEQSPHLRPLGGASQIIPVGEEARQDDDPETGSAGSVG